MNMIHHLRTLGPVGLNGPDGAPVRSVMSQPKRFALLTYLAADPTVRHPRENLLDLLWQELGPDRGRRALRQALHGLRRSLGPGVITGKGSELIGVDPEELSCDAAEFTRAIGEGRDEDALNLYRGPFLEGFHLDGAPRFERWVERRRRALGRAAVEAAWRLADRDEEAGRARAARGWAARAVELAPYDGEGVRRYMQLLMRGSQPALALRAYRAYASRIRDELELEPSVETARLAEELQRSVATAGDRGPTGSGAQEVTDLDRTTRREGIRSDISDDTPPSTPVHGAEDRWSSGSRVGVTVIALALFLAGAAAVLWMDRARIADDEVRSERSVAVLPFADMSPAGDHRWFADGLAEEILDVLTRVQGIEVKGRSSSFQFGGTDPDIRLVGDSLDVGSVLEGSVRRAGDRVRITVQLVRSSDGSHLWSKTYARELTPQAIFQIQQDVARSVADALEVELGLVQAERVATRPPADLEAYSLYLRARHGFRQRSAEGRTRAVALLDEALERDSTFAAAWTLRARILVLAPFWEGVDWQQPLADAWAEARAASLRALELDPTHARTHSTRAFVLDQLHRWDESHRHHRRAISLNTGDPDVRGAYLWHSASRGLWDRALEQARYRQRLDPLYTPANGNLAEMLMYSGRLQDAEEQWDRTVALAGEAEDAHAAFVRSLRVKLYVLQGRMHEAVRGARAARRDAGESPQPSTGYYLSQLAAVEALAGNRRTARVLLDSMRLRWRDGLPEARRALEALYMARVHASLGAADSAYLWLDRSRPEIWRVLEIARFRGDPWWSPVRGDARGLEILERTGTVGPAV